MTPLIKWPGGKSGEIRQVQALIPPHKRYVEPFLGGGAIFFHLQPERAAVNDISADLIGFYRLVRAQDENLRRWLMLYDAGFQGVLRAGEDESEGLTALFAAALAGEAPSALADEVARRVVVRLPGAVLEELVPDPARFEARLARALADKARRTAAHPRKRPFSPEDLRENLLTGLTGGFYLYFRSVFNDLSLGRLHRDEAYRAANFYFIREYCYGSMFRYNAAGEFNIPYGGRSYSRKDFRAKIDRIFSRETAAVLAGADLSCGDFEPFLQGLDLTEEDFLFLDPPYDTDFSDYEGRDFAQADQRRLAGFLRHTRANFLLVIKNTDFIRELYEKEFVIRPFEKKYTYNMRRRNDRRVEHLIISNFLPKE